MKNPWKVLSSRPVYSNPWISVREDSVITPRGSEGIYGVVSFRGAVAVVAINASDEVYLVGQYRYPVDEYTWELVEGAANSGESPLESAKRELKEEVGVTARTWVQLGGDVQLSNCVCDERAYVFLATDLEEGECEPDETEVLQVRKMPFAECIAWVNRGEAKDALTIIGVTRARHHLGR